MAHLQVTTSTPDRDSAAKIAAAAVAGKLAATAKVHGPVTSFWWHLGKQGDGQEWQAVFQTTQARFAQLEALIIAEHPWQKPEVSTVPLGGNADYLEWVISATTD